LTTAIRKLRMILNRSPRAGWIASLFILGILMLMALLWYQVRKASNIELPVDQQRISSMMGLMAVPGRDSREVLILNSYHLGYSWSDNEMRGIVEGLMKADARIQPRIDFLDCKHHPKMEHFDRLRDLFLQKYGDKNFPVVIVADNPALQFTLKYRPQLFPRAAIVFCGINGFDAKMIEGHDNVTGVAEILDAGDTLEQALKLHPGARSAEGRRGP